MKVLFAFIFFAGLISKNLAAKEEPMMKAYEIAKTLPWLNVSRPLTAEDLLGKVVLLDFWTYCCINCIHILPDLKKLEHEFPQDLVVIGVHSAKFENEKNSENIREAVLRYQIEHPVINDKEFLLWRMFDIHSWPSFVLLDSRGMYRGSTAGEGQYETLKAAIVKMIDEGRKSGSLKNTRLPLRREAAPSGPLLYPGKMTFDATNKKVWISDSNHNRILRMNQNGEVDLIVGSGEVGHADGDFSTAEFFQPQGVLADGPNIYVADTSNHLIRRIDMVTQKVETIAGTGKQGYDRRPSGPALQTSLASPWDLAIYKDRLAIAMAGTHQIWGLDLQKSRFEVLAGSGQEDIHDGAAHEASLAQTSGLSTVGKKLFFADSETSSIRYLENEKVHTLVGTGLFDFGLIDGPTSKARLQHALGLVATQDKVFVADTYNSAVREIDLKTKQVSTLVHKDLSEPNDLLLLEDKLWILDTNHHGIKVFDLKTKKLSKLEIKLPELKSATPAKEKILKELPFLPNLKNLAESAGGLSDLKFSAEISLKLPEGNKINSEAPSNWQIYEKISDGWKKIAEGKIETKKSAKTKIRAEVSKKSETLAIDFEIYHCPEKESALSACEIKSFRTIVKPKSGLLVINADVSS